MCQVFKLLDVKIIIINMVAEIMEKVNMYEQMGNVSRERETVKKN